MAAPQEYEDKHWSDIAAERVLRDKGDKARYVCASGITPSGTVHIGNVRELITVDFVAKALRRQGKNVRFIFSWDDYDVFRKVPKNMPKQEELATYLGQPINRVPDPFGKYESYALYHQKAIEDIIGVIGIAPEFLYQHKKYIACEYTAQMKQALVKVGEIRAILNKYRTEPLPETWLPLTVFPDNCGADEIEILRWDGDDTVTYRETKTGTEVDVSIANSGKVKLLWRVDWPMRWAFEGVDFEPGGKDHSSDGGSHDTAKEIVKAIYAAEPPVYLQYDFVTIKGRGGKISSSKGDVITLDDALEVYEPQVIRFMFASYKPNTDFALSFDLDALKFYEDFDRCERVYFGLEEVGAKKASQMRRLYEISCIGEVPKAIPFQPALRHLTNILQIHAGDFAKVKAHYAKDLKTDLDVQRLESRMRCAWRWICDFAPEDFKFALNAEPKSIAMEAGMTGVVRETRELLAAQLGTIEEKALHEAIYAIVHKYEQQPADFFKVAYQLLIGKDKGPKLASFMLTLPKERLLALLEI